MRHLWAWGVVSGFVGLVVGLVAALIASPKRGALLVRYVFERDSAKVREVLDRYAPDGVVAVLDQQYCDADDEARLDVYFPEAADEPGAALPTVVWTHGGAWVSGAKDDVAPYFQLIATQGYTVISLGYALAPGKLYPTPVHQVNAALGYIRRNAERFRADVDRIVMAGDSAGTQITSQVAALITNPCIAGEMRIDPALRPEQLRGVILFCGIYDMAKYMERATAGPVRMLRWGTKTSLWAYIGRKVTDSVELRQMSSIDHVTAEFPPAFISGGNSDALTDLQSRPFAARLEGLGVEVTSLFYSADHEPALGHEYQFKLDLPDARNALGQMLEFLRRYTSA